MASSFDPVATPEQLPLCPVNTNAKGEGKKSYLDKVAADSYAVYLKNGPFKDAPLQTGYKCPDCPYFHLTTKSQEIPYAPQLAVVKMPEVPQGDYWTVNAERLRLRRELVYKLWDAGKGRTEIAT